LSKVRRQTKANAGVAPAALLCCAVLFLAALPVAASSPYGSAADKYPAGSGGKDDASPLMKDNQGAVFLRWGSFDPEAGGRPEIDPSFAGKMIFLASFSEDVAVGELRALDDPELAFLEKIPEKCFLVKASEGGLAKLRSHSKFRRAFALKAEDKIAPALLSGKWREPVVVEALLARGESPAPLESRTRSELFLGALGKVQDGMRLRWLVGSAGVADFARDLASFGQVVLVSPFFLPKPLNDDSIWVIQSYDTADRRNYALSASMFVHGILGEGEIAGISDSGMDNDMCYFSYDGDGFATASYPVPPDAGPLDASKKVIGYPVLPGATAYDNNATCGVTVNFHGTHTAGTLAGDNYMNLASAQSFGHDTGDGMAPMAKIYFQDVGDDASGCLTGLANDYGDIFGQAWNAGVRVHSNSWGSASGSVYGADSVSADEFLYRHEDFSLFFAAGNSGPFGGTIDSPATAKNCVAVGSVVSGASGANMVSDFSSRGPAADGRIKPDVMAPGENIVSASGTVSSDDGNCGFKWLSGTSMATPTAAGGALLLREYFVRGFYPGGAANGADGFSPSSSLMKSALIAGAMDVGAADIPNDFEGWGRVNLDRFAWFSDNERDALRCVAYDVRNEAGLQDGEEMNFKITLDQAGPLKAVLVWLDPEGSPMSSVALVNDLDLEVVSPSGTAYYGNNFSSGVSVQGGQKDRRNNVEAFYLSAAQAGQWQVKVKGFSVNGTPREPDSDRQGFALAILKPAGDSPSAAPQGLSAYDLGEGGISLSWSGVAGADSYSIYRMREDGRVSDPPVSFIGSAATPGYTDAKAQGGYRYTYFVRASRAGFEGPASGRATATSTGNCSLSPDFAGVVSAASDDRTPGCDIILDWSPASSRCPLQAGLSYNVYRGSVPDFIPSASTLIAAGVQGLTYTDSGLPSGNTSYYIVRAEDSGTSGGGPANGGNEESNNRRINATPFGEPLETGEWSDDGGDSLALMSLEGPWTITSARNHTPYGKYSYAVAESGLTYAPNTCASLTTPLLDLRGDSIQLSYSVSYNLENGWDGVVAEISENGTDFTALIPTEGYPGSFSYTGNPPLNRCGFASSRGAFSGPKLNDGLTPWALYTHDLSSYKGKKVKVRWRFSSDPASEYQGFFLDDVKVTGVFLPSSCEGSLPGVAFEKAIYNCSATISVRVSDAERKGSGRQSVLVSSDTETSPETVTVLETPAGSGYFTGTIDAQPSGPSPDGKLSVTDGDTIYAIYAGESGSAESRAVADCAAPVLLSSSITSLSPTAIGLNFAASESVTAEVRYGKGGALDHLVKDGLLSESHYVEISGLEKCSDYGYEITITDVAGNSFSRTGSSFSTKGCLPAPVIAAVKKMTDPFRLIVKGSGFTTDSVVKINGYPVPDTLYKSSTRVVAKKGTPLKNMLPKGVTVEVTIFNPSDMTESEKYYFAR